MSFTSIDFAVFMILVFAGYWLLPTRRSRNVLLLVVSYLFYGYVHPWFCLLIGASTIVDYVCCLRMARQPSQKKIFLITSLVFNLGMLGFFKYYDFFATSVQSSLAAAGVDVSSLALNIYLPVGISFYTFQTLSYSIDVYRGRIEARNDFIDFATFVALFPQLVAGPIERASRLLPQIEKKQQFSKSLFATAWPLLIRGYLKKLVVADNMSIYADQVFALESPGLPLMLAGTLAFTLQIFCDFSGYTDMARGSAKLFGFQLMENFNAPYAAISPSDFWRRWHISLSSWINDYLYIPLGGSRVRGKARFLLVLLITMGLSGLWHGAAWNFLVWGVYHALLLFLYHLLGKSGRWQPSGAVSWLFAWFLMLCFTVVGWAIFRAPSLSWLWSTMTGWVDNNSSAQALLVARSIIALVAVYAVSLWAFLLADRRSRDQSAGQYLLYGIALCLLFLFASSGEKEFIYFRF